MIKKQNIVSLLNRDFAGLKKDLIEYSKAYASGSFTDFNESSPGMTILEFCAYIGDNLNFYLDQAFKESGDSATQLENIQANAKMRGYRPLGKRAASGKMAVAIQVPATTDNIGNVVPSDSYTPSLLKGSQAVSKNNKFFETLEDIDFTASLGRNVTGSQFDSDTGLPTHFAIQKFVNITAGKTVTENFSINEFERFKKLELSQEDVIEIISVFDSSGNEWFEVDYLAQDWVFTSKTNENLDNSAVPYVLKLKTVPRRFIVDRDIVSNRTKLIFGSGDGVNFDDELIPNISSYSLPLAGRKSFSSISIDPVNFLNTRSLGLSPYNTIITVTYRVGGGADTNVPARSINQMSSAIFSWASTSLDAVKKGAVEGSIGCLNLESTSGGGETETIFEIKSNASAHFSSQQRIVTREDIISRVVSLPSKFGKIEKAFVENASNTLSYNIYILSSDENGNLSFASQTLKNNLVEYLKKYKILTDGINILDAKILNIKLNYGIVVDPGKNKSQILLACNRELKKYFSKEKSQIMSAIVISDIISIINNVNGVSSVYEVSFTNVFGTVSTFEYSNEKFSIAEYLKDGMLMCPQRSIFEIKYPEKDIVGSAK